MKRTGKMIALLLAALLCAALFSAAAAAENADGDVWVNGTLLTGQNAAGSVSCGVGQAVYDPSSGVLTLTDAVMTKLHEETAGEGMIGACVFATGDLTIELTGESTVAPVFSMGANVLNCGIWCGGELTLRGNGSLNVSGGLSTFRTAGIYAKSAVIGGDITVEASGGRLTGSVGTSGWGIATEEDVRFTGNAAVNAVSFQPRSEFFPSVSEGISAGGEMTVEKNAAVSSIANRSASEGGDALALRGNLTVTGGSLRAKAVGENGCGIRISSDHPTPLNVTSGFVFATGGSYAMYSRYGKVSVHPEYRVTGASLYNANERAAKAQADAHYDGGLYYVVTENGEVVTAKTVYFVRPVTEYGLWVGGTQVTNYNCGDILGDGKAVYDRNAATLTLSGAQISGGRHENAYLYAEEALTIRLADGSASTVGGFNHETTEKAYGVYAAKGLTVTGGGSLTVASGDAEKDAFGVYVRIGALNAEGCSLTAKAGDAADNSAGVYLASETSGVLSLSEMASLSGAGGQAQATIGVSVNGGVSVTGASSLSGRGGDNAAFPQGVSYGVRCGGAMVLDDASSAEGTGGRSAKFSVGLFALNSKEGVTVRGGRMTCRSGEGADSCYGLYAKTSVTVAKGTLTAVAGKASGNPGSMSYAVTAKTVAFSGGTVTATADEAAASCGVYADKIVFSGAAELTASCPADGAGHALRRGPSFTGFAPVVYAGQNAPGELTESPTEATYVNNAYLRIEKRFRSEKVWFALPIFDGSGRYASRWIGFTSDDVTTLGELGAGVDKTGAAEYYNGYIYGVTADVPFRFWRARMDGASMGQAEILSDSVRFTFGDMAYDYATNTMYGLGSFNMRRAIFAVELGTGASRLVTEISGTRGELLTLAFDRAGVCYGIDLNGVLYQISLKSGRAAVVGDTGLVPDGAQSMAFDRDTGELYWAYFNGQNGQSGYYCVDTQTGEAVLVGQVGGAHMELAGLFSIPREYDIWIGGVRVNTENAADVFGNGLVSFDPAAGSLTFNGMKITTFTQAYKNYSFGVLVKDMDVELIFRGENAIALEDVYTDYSASICVFNGKAAIRGGRLTILPTKAKLDNTILCPDGLTVEDCDLTVYSNHNAITVNSEGAAVTVKDSTVGIQAGHIGIAAVKGGVHIADSTVAVSADKDDNVTACAVAALDDLTLQNSVFAVTAEKNTGVIAGRIIAEDSAFEATGAEQAINANVSFTHREGTAVVVSNGKSAESMQLWDGTSPLTNYNFIRATACEHSYDSPSDTECDICGHIRYVTPNGTAFAPGDVDGDGEISSADARLALRRSVMLEDYPEDSAAYSACDADRDGEVTSADARLILRASVGLETLA